MTQKAALKTSLFLAAAGALLTGGLLLLVSMDSSEILIQSRESRTLTGGPVFNRIRYFARGPQEIWMMQQSHSGASAQARNWDRLAIVVDTAASPKTARFYQLEPGSLEWTGKAKEAPYRAACFMCHTNGPRAIRPDLASRSAPVSAWEGLRIKLWNLKIARSRRIQADPAHGLPNETSAILSQASAKTPFRLDGKFENQRLEVQACARCHRESKRGRGQLTRQNFLAISFMVEEGLMPPSGEMLSKEDRKAVLRFARGLD